MAKSMYITVSVLMAAVGAYAVMLIAVPERALKMFNSTNRRFVSGARQFRLPLDSGTGTQCRTLGAVVLFVIGWIWVDTFRSIEPARPKIAEPWHFGQVLGVVIIFTATITSAVYPQYFIRAWKDHMDPELLGSAHFELILRLMGVIGALMLASCFCRGCYDSAAVPPVIICRGRDRNGGGPDERRLHTEIGEL